MRAVNSNSLPPYDVVASAPHRRVPTELVTLRLHGAARQGLLERVPLVEGVDDAARELALKIARACSAVQPCLPRLVDIEAAPDALNVLWSMTEAIPFTDVRTALREQECPLELRLRVAVDLLTALEQLTNVQREWLEPHACVHGEITPDTLMVGANGVTRLTGLPTARRARSAADAPCHPAFVAAELVDGNAAPTARSDLYAVGAILCELLTLRPFATHPHPVTPDGAGWAAAVASLARRCLSPRPAMRPTNAAAVLTELRSAATGHLMATGAFADWMTATFADRLREQQAAWRARDASSTPPDELSVPALPVATQLVAVPPVAPLPESDVLAIRDFFASAPPPAAFPAEPPTNPRGVIPPRDAFPSLPPTAPTLVTPAVPTTPLVATAPLAPMPLSVDIEMDDDSRDELTSPGLRTLTKRRRRRALVVLAITATCACIAAAGVAVRPNPRPAAAPVGDARPRPRPAPSAIDSSTEPKLARAPVGTAVVPVPEPALSLSSPMRPGPSDGKSSANPAVVAGAPASVGATPPPSPAASASSKSGAQKHYDPLGI